MEVARLYFSDALDGDGDLPAGIAGAVGVIGPEVRWYLSEGDRRALIEHLQKFTPEPAEKPLPRGDRSVVVEVIGRVVLDLGQTHRAMVGEGFTTSAANMQTTIDTLVRHLVSGGEG